MPTITADRNMISANTDDYGDTQQEIRRSIKVVFGESSDMKTVYAPGGPVFTSVVYTSLEIFYLPSGEFLKKPVRLDVEMRPGSITVFNEELGVAGYGEKTDEALMDFENCIKSDYSSLSSIEDHMLTEGAKLLLERYGSMFRGR